MKHPASLDEEPQVAKAISTPSGWEFRRLKYLSKVRPSNVNKKSNDEQEEVKLCNYTDVYYNNEIREGLDFMEATASDSQIEKFRLRKGDVIITKDSESWDDIGVPSYVAQDFEDVVCGYHLFLLRPFQEQILPKYLYWTLESEVLSYQFEKRAKGVTRYGISRYEVETVQIPLPPIETQDKICQYLDETTGKIDDLCEKLGSVPAILEEKRQAIITDAVTGKISSSDLNSFSEEQEAFR